MRSGSTNVITPGSTSPSRVRRLWNRSVNFGSPSPSLCGTRLGYHNAGNNVTTGQRWCLAKPSQPLLGW